jgi:hypothetical protein
MKNTRLILTLAAALLFGMAVYAHARANSSVSTSGSSTFKVHDDNATGFSE